MDWLTDPQIWASLLTLIALEDGEIVAHSTICPHWRGPLDACLPQLGILPVARLPR